MKIQVKLDQHSTQRGIILLIGGIVSVIFEWYGKSSIQIIPLTISIIAAGTHGVIVDDKTTY